MAVPKTKDKSSGKKTAARRSPIASVSEYLADVRSEFRKVIWPDRAEITSSTIVVLVTLVFFIAVIGVLDLAFEQIIKSMLPSIGG